MVSQSEERGRKKEDARLERYVAADGALVVLELGNDGEEGGGEGG